MLGLPPCIALIGQPAKAGFILGWRQHPDRTWEALASWQEMVHHGSKVEFVEHQAWLQADKVQQIEGEDYSKVPRTRG